VRELRAAVERAVLLGDTQEAPPAAAPVAGLDFSVPFRVAKERVVGAWERSYVSELCTRHGGNVSAAARAAKMDRNYLREVMRKHGLTASD
jgi:DNA-binding NtrC family response regulator